MSADQGTTAADHRWLAVVREDIEPPDRELIGGKAWSLWRMRSLGLRVPPAFVVTTEACERFFADGERLPPGLGDELRSGIEGLESDLGRRFGGAERPLLVSVRSGAAVSMPGMMDTILNLGINPTVEAGLAEETSAPNFAAEVHRRFTGFYGRLVLGCLDELDDLATTAEVSKAVQDDTGESIPEDPWVQLEAAVAAVFASSRTRRAVAYRKHHGIRQDLGTAVTVQAMVFGNLDEASGTGVLFTRNPLTGAAEVYGEYLPQGQGEDVVSGRLTPRPLDHLAEAAPEVHQELLVAADRLDADGRDAQDIEFTVQRGVLYLLQSRAAKRTARAAVHIAVDLVNDGVITADEALQRVQPEQVRALLRPELAKGSTDGAELLAEGVTACPGAVTGPAVGTPEEAEANPGSVLVSRTTSPEDVHGMIAAVAVVTEQGGATSHAAVVSRALDRPCVVGCGDGVGSRLIGRTVTVDATAGKIYDGELEATAPSEEDDPDLAQLTIWARDRAPLRVVADIDDAPAPCFEYLGDPEETGPAIPDRTASVTGPWFSTSAGVIAALEAGVTTVVADRELPVLLAALAHQPTPKEPVT